MKTYAITQYFTRTFNERVNSSFKILFIQTQFTVRLGNGPENDVLAIFYMLEQFSFTTSQTVLDCYYKKASYLITRN